MDSIVERMSSTAALSLKTLDRDDQQERPHHIVCGVSPVQLKLSISTP